MLFVALTGALLLRYEDYINYGRQVRRTCACLTHRETGHGTPRGRRHVSCEQMMGCGYSRERNMRCSQSASCCTCLVIVYLGFRAAPKPSYSNFHESPGESLVRANGVYSSTAWADALKVGFSATKAVPTPQRHGSFSNWSPHTRSFQFRPFRDRDSCCRAGPELLTSRS